MKKRIVDIADMIVSSNPEDTIVTYALGPCLGVVVTDAEAQVGGMIHCQLPTAKNDVARAKANPAQFVDVGVVALLEQVYALGARREHLKVFVAGGAQVVGDLTCFQIAQRNYQVLRKLLWKNDMLIEAEDVGGSIPRNMVLHVGTGEVRIQSAGQDRRLGGKPECFTRSVVTA